MATDDRIADLVMSTRDRIIDLADGDTSELRLICAALLGSVAAGALGEDGVAFSRYVADAVEQAQELDD